MAPSPKAGFDHLDGEDTVEFAARFGLKLDPWQQDLCRLWMRRGQGGKWCAGTWGISVPRQNGKNGTLEAVELFGMVVLGLRFMHSAHEVKTARKHFRRMKEFFGEKRDDPHARYPELNALVKDVRSTNGQEAIYLWDAETREDRGWIEVTARTGGAGRGFTNDMLVIDEAQHLEDDQLEALRPAISAAPSGDPVAIYMGTPPKPSALSEEGKGAAFVRVRNGAVTGKSKRAAWMEFGVEADLDSLTDLEIVELAADRSLWARVNPALGRRLFEQTLEDELGELGARSFARERLNVWPVVKRDGRGCLDVIRWRGLSIGGADQGWPLAAVGLDMDPSSGRLWVAPCAFSEAGVHVELLPDDLLVDGSDAAVSWLFQRVRRRLPVVIPADSPATVLAASLAAKKVKVHLLNGPEQVQASAAFEKAMRDKTLSHIDDPVLETCVRESEKDSYGRAGQWRLKRTGEFAAAPLYAAAGAYFGATKWSKRPASSDAVPTRATRSSAVRASSTRGAVRV